MTRRKHVISLALLAGLVAHACQYDHDTVLPGYYAQDGATAMTDSRMEASSAQQAQVAQRSNSQTAQGATDTATDAGGSAERIDPSAANQATNAMTGTSASSSSGSTGDADNGPSSAQQDPSTAQTAPTADGADSATDGTRAESSETPAGECDLTGRWLVTSHLTTDALGSLQTVHYYEYFEIEQQGDAFEVMRGFMCGTGTSADSTLSASVDFSAAEATYPTRVRYDGRPGTSKKVADGCQVELETWYTVRGVTIPYYLDPANTLPTADEPATDTTPGWEDWDGDGNPGITGYLSGIVSGEIYVGPRVWTAMSGTVTDTSLLRLSVKWGQEQNVMAFDGSPLLATEAAIGPDPASHFAQFARLSADQATGDEAAICAAVTELAPQLTPEAAGS